MTKTIPASEVKTRFFELLKAVAKRADEVVVTKDGRPAAILLNYEEFERLMETLDILSDPKAMERIKKAERYLKKDGPFLTHEEVFGSSLA